MKRSTKALIMLAISVPFLMAAWSQSFRGDRTIPTTLNADTSVTGDIITVTFGETVVFGELCYPDATADEWLKALGTNAAVKHPALGIALDSAGDGETGRLLLSGTIRDDTAFSSAASGDVVYLSDGTAGDVVYAAPSDTGDIVQIVGFGIAAGYIFFNPDATYTEVP